jgi:DNA polymerase I-like protein with 3'-5' exonuclease and polymerase domains
MGFSSNVVLDAEHLAEVASWFSKQDAVVFDTEAMGDFRGEPTRNQLNWISLASYGRAVAIPFGHPNGDRLLKKATRKKNKVTGKFDMFPPEYDDPPEQLRPGQVFEALQPLFFNENITKIAHNAVFDFVAIAKYYDHQLAAGPHCDTIVLQWLLNENILNKGLKQLTERYYGVKYDHENVGKKVEIHPFSKVAHYAFMDARYTWLLFKRFDPMFEKFPELKRVRRLEEALIPVLCRMKMAGIDIDTDVLAHLDKDLGEQIVLAESDVYRAAGTKFNLDSTPQKATMLFGPKSEGGQGLKGTTLTPGGMKKKRAGLEILPVDYTTQADHLEQFAGNPLVDGILKYQELDKLHGTYVTGYLGDPADPKKPCRIYDGKVHADLVQYGTVTGRFSCREPNLQNVPRPGSENGKKIRGLFYALPGEKLCVADYGQIELVVLAHFCGHGALFDGFYQGVDPHSATAAALIGEDARKFMKRVEAGDPGALALRQVAKGINFAVVFGAGPDKVASMAGITVFEAKRFLAVHERAFPEIYETRADIIRACRKNRYVTTLLGRRRRLPTIYSRSDRERMKAERQAVNSQIQGSAADLIKIAMVRLDKLLPDEMDLVLSVHDELVVRTPEDRAEECAGLMREAMLGPGIQDLVKVPLSADLKIVDRWSEAK